MKIRHPVGLRHPVASQRQCIDMGTYSYSHIYMYVCIHIYLYIFVYIYIYHIYIHVYTQGVKAAQHANDNENIASRPLISMHIYMYVHMLIHSCIHIYTYIGGGSVAACQRQCRFRQQATQSHARIRGRFGRVLQCAALCSSVQQCVMQYAAGMLHGHPDTSAPSQVLLQSESKERWGKLL